MHNHSSLKTFWFTFNEYKYARPLFLNSSCNRHKRAPGTKLIIQGREWSMLLLPRENLEERKVEQQVRQQCLSWHKVENSTFHGKKQAQVMFVVGWSKWRWDLFLPSRNMLWIVLSMGQISRANMTNIWTMSVCCVIYC